MATKRLKIFTEITTKESKNFESTESSDGEDDEDNSFLEKWHRVCTEDSDPNCSA